MQMKPYVICQGVFSFVDSSFPCPSPHVLLSDDSTASVTFGFGINQAFLSQKQQDQLILRALLSSFSMNILHLMVDCSTFASVWSTQEHAFCFTIQFSDYKITCLSSRSLLR